MRIQTAESKVADHHQPRRCVVDAFGDSLAAEEQDAEKRRFEKEGQKALGRQRRPEDAADVARVVRPVGAEGELHGQARGDADGEGRGEEPDPEVRGRFVRGDAALEVTPLGEHHHQGEADADRYEDEVIPDGERELQSGKHQGVHACAPPPGKALCPSARDTRLRSGAGGLVSPIFTVDAVSCQREYVRRGTSRPAECGAVSIKRRLSSLFTPRELVLPCARGRHSSPAVLL